VSGRRGLPNGFDSHADATSRPSVESGTTERTHMSGRTEVARQEGFEHPTLAGGEESIHRANGAQWVLLKFSEAAIAGLLLKLAFYPLIPGVRVLFTAKEDLRGFYFRAGPDLLASFSISSSFAAWRQRAPRPNPSFPFGRKFASEIVKLLDIFINFLLIRREDRVDRTWAYANHLSFLSVVPRVLGPGLEPPRPGARRDPGAFLRSIIVVRNLSRFHGQKTSLRPSQSRRFFSGRTSRTFPMILPPSSKSD